MKLHLFNDGLGFYCLETIKAIEHLDQNNLYWNSSQNAKFAHPKLQLYTYKYNELKKSIESLENIEVVYFHFFQKESVAILHLLKQKFATMKTVWVFWSADLYNLEKFSGNLYLPFSASFIKKTYVTKFARKKIANIKNTITFNPFYISDRAFLKSIGQIDYIACILNTDYTNILKYANANCARIQFAYLGYTQLIASNLIESFSTGSAIMVNHSADPTLNHFEILQELKKKKIDNKIVLPLSYGRQPYIDAIKQAAKDCNFMEYEIQEMFVPKEQYTINMLNYGFAIFNSKVQQAVGNIIPLLWFGVKVFLRNENSVFIDFKNYGFHIFSVQDDLPNESFGNRLTLLQAQENREKIRSLFSAEKMSNYYKNLLFMNN
jgi:dTDP-N-acetylfucosamine:lipid II N-acetylfucosaminyltransferase